MLLIIIIFQRGIGAFSPPPGELLGAAHCLARLRGTEETAVIITGFPCLLDFDPPTETDGPVNESEKVYGSGWIREEFVVEESTVILSIS